MALAGQLRAEALAHLVDRAAMNDGVGPGEIDVFEDARPRRFRRERLVGMCALLVEDDDFAGLDVADELGADDVERAGLRAQDRAGSSSPSTSGRMPSGSRAP